MAELQRLRSIQYPASVVFTFKFDDTMRDINGVMRDFGSLTGGSSSNTTYTFRLAAIPKGAVVTRGSLSRSQAFTGPTTFNVTVGDTASTNRYLALTDVKALGVTTLIPTGYVSDGEDLVLTFNTQAGCTAGRAMLEISYVRPDFVSEVAL